MARGGLQTGVEVMVVYHSSTERLRPSSRKYVDKEAATSADENGLAL